MLPACWTCFIYEHPVRRRPFVGGCDLHHQARHMGHVDPWRAGKQWLYMLVQLARMKFSHKVLALWECYVDSNKYHASSNKCIASSNKCLTSSNKCLTSSNKCLTSSNKCLTSSNKKLLETINGIKLSMLCTCILAIQCARPWPCARAGNENVLA